jgi:peptidoglycan hydrolase FlgJ
MAISPVGDIVMDVVRAADPTEAQAARAKLAAGGAPAAAGGAETFSINDASVPSPQAPRRAETKAAQPFQRFEAMVLQNFIDTMLPDNNASLGGGMAGEMWKGLLAEKLAGAMAERGGIGIANRLLADHYAVDGKPVAIGPVSEAPSQDQAGETMLPSALVDELQRKAAATLRPDAPEGGRDDQPSPWGA